MVQSEQEREGAFSMMTLSLYMHIFVAVFLANSNPAMSCYLDLQVSRFRHLLGESGVCGYLEHKTPGN